MAPTQLFGSGYPAAWDGLRNLLRGLPAAAVQSAIDVQLQFKPSAEVYDFLTRTAELAVKVKVNENS